MSVQMETRETTSVPDHGVHTDKHQSPGHPTTKHQSPGHPTTKHQAPGHPTTKHQPSEPPTTKDVSPPNHVSPGSVTKKDEVREMFDPTLSFQGREVFRSGTPDTFLPDFPTKPDISMQCRRCGLFILLPDLRDHRYYHSALSLLKYYGANRPNTVEALFRRRNTVLKKFRSSSTSEKPLNPQLIHYVNEAYEYLKADLDGSLEEIRNVKTEINTKVDGVAINSSCPCVLAVGFCSTSNDQWKSYMEDTRTFQDSFGGDPNKNFFGLYDGHHGHFASEMCASNLHNLLRFEMSKFDPNTSFLNPDSNSFEEIAENDFSCVINEKFLEEFVDDESFDIVHQIVKICEKKYNSLSRENTKNSKNNLRDGDIDSGEKKVKLKSPMVKGMEAALRKTYHLMDIFLSYGKNECSRARWSGCSALTAVVHSEPSEDLNINSERVTSPDQEEVIEDHNKEIQNNPESQRSRDSHSPPRQLGHIYLANAGNVQGVLIRGNRTYRLSKDHTPHNPRERERVVKAGGTISNSRKDTRVNGVITATRGLGNHGDKNLKKCILVDPHTITVPVDQYAQILLIASSGIWEVFTIEEAAHFVKKLLPSNYVPPPTDIHLTLQNLFEGEKNSMADSVSRRKPSGSYTSSQHQNEGSSAAEDGTKSVLSNVDSSKSGPEDIGLLQTPNQNETIEQTTSSSSPQRGSSANSNRSLEKFVLNIEDFEKEDKSEDITPTRVSIGMTDISIKMPPETEHSNKENILDVPVDEESVKINIDHFYKDKKSNDTDIVSDLKETDVSKTFHSSKGFETDRTFNDMKTEIGSHVEGYDSEPELGNEAELETIDDMSRPFSHLSQYCDISSRDQIQRDVAKKMAEHLVQAALLAGAKDNLTVMVAILPGSAL